MSLYGNDGYTCASCCLSAASGGARVGDVRVVARGSAMAPAHVLAAADTTLTRLDVVQPCDLGTALRVVMQLGDHVQDRILAVAGRPVRPDRPAVEPAPPGVGARRGCRERPAGRTTPGSRRAQRARGDRGVLVAAALAGHVGHPTATPARRDRQHGSRRPLGVAAHGRLRLIARFEDRWRRVSPRRGPDNAARASGGHH